MTTLEVAAALSVPVRTVYWWRSQGLDCPPAAKVGRHLRWSRADVEQWLRRRTGI